MVAYTIRRLAQLALTLFGGFVLLFLLFFTLPSDPARVIASGNGKAPSEELVQATEKRLGLDKPALEQFWDRFTETVTLSGASFRTREPVADMVRERLPNSVRLAAWAMAIEVAVGVSTGVLSARRRGSLVDAATTVAAVVASAIPVFVLGYLLRQFTGVYASEHGWASVFRLPPLTTTTDGWWLLLIPTWEQLKSLIQPALVLASVSTAVVARLTRTSMLEFGTAEHVRTARAKGLTERQISRRHVLRNALLPVVTYVGVDFGVLIGFAVLTETVFDWPGLGSKVASAAAQSDLPVVLALSMVVMAVFGFANLLVDLSYAWLDPRIRLGDVS